MYQVLRSLTSGAKQMTIGRCLRRAAMGDVVSSRLTSSRGRNRPAEESALLAVSAPRRDHGSQKKRARRHWRRDGRVACACADRRSMCDNSPQRSAIRLRVRDQIGGRLAFHIADHARTGTRTAQDFRSRRRCREDAGGTRTGIGRGSRLSDTRSVPRANARSHVVADEWTPRYLDDNDEFSAFSRVVGNAIGALVLGDELTLDERQAALQPFASVTGISQAAAPQENESGTCQQVARTIHPVPPHYPPSASVSGTVVVDIVVTLDERGDVRSAKPLANTMGDRPGAADFADAALLAAAESTYVPSIRDCKVVNGPYVFRVVFKSALNRGSPFVSATRNVYAQGRPEDGTV